jgi:hypothetical protein
MNINTHPFLPPHLHFILSLSPLHILVLLPPISLPSAELEVLTMDLTPFRKRWVPKMFHADFLDLYMTTFPKKVSQLQYQHVELPITSFATLAGKLCSHYCTFLFNVSYCI